MVIHRKILILAILLCFGSLVVFHRLVSPGMSPMLVSILKNPVVQMKLTKDELMQMNVTTKFIVATSTASPTEDIKVPFCDGCDAFAMVFSGNRLNQEE